MTLGKINRGRILFRIIFIMLLAPLVQQNLHLIKVRKLKGAIKKIEKTEYKWKKWLSEEYQANTEKYVNQNFGFRNWLVKLNNQVEYTFFNKVNAKSVIYGKEEYLFERNYISAYYGSDFIGKDKIDANINKIKQLQDTLHDNGQELIIVFAAGKGSFYPEYIPDEFHTKKGITNHEYYAKRAKEENINHIDFNTWFLNNKNKTEYLLYPRTGIHWSYYGMTLVIDSMLNYIEDKMEMDIPDFYWNDVELSRKPRHTDADIEKGLNLIFKISNDKLAYPDIKYEEKEKFKPTALVVADSYYWGIYNTGLSKKVFKKGKFWFYNKQVYPDSFKKKTFAKDLDLSTEIKDKDLVILMVTDANLPKFPWGFIDELYNIYY